MEIANETPMNNVSGPEILKNDTVFETTQAFKLDVEFSDNKNDFIKRMVLCVIYAVFFTFCLYKNPEGITYPLFSAATIAAYILFTKSVKEKIKPFSYALMGIIMLLSVNVCMTKSVPLIVFDKIFVFGLFFVMFLNNLYDDVTWDVSRYFLAIISVIGSSVAYLLDPMIDFVRLRRNTDSETSDKGKNRGTILYILLGFGISLPLLGVVLPLLSSSDAVFSDMLSSVFEIKFNGDIIGVVMLTLLIFFVGYALIKRLYNKFAWLKQPVGDMRKVNPTVAITVSSVLLVFYALYSGIQIIFLFLGFGTLPEGYTYADYAHEGFFQLVFVCLINLVLVLVCRKYSKDNVILKVMLTLICTCTYIMLFSSAYRMILYISVYGLTFLRVYVLWALLVIALAMAGTIILVYKNEFPFFKYSLCVLTITWAAFTFSHPDRIIADYNLTNEMGVNYVISSLSDDATPVIIEHGYGLSESGYVSHEMPKDFRKFNFAQYEACKAIYGK
ncbi:MAG: DUF4173 domain-containing protein [Lachnospiraceae bacterium]|nr:DUF4173 domain-containing protein [Lachnospiraceae bacterium]